MEKKQIKVTIRKSAPPPVTVTVVSGDLFVIQRWIYGNFYWVEYKETGISELKIYNDQLTEKIGIIHSNRSIEWI